MDSKVAPVSGGIFSCSNYYKAEIPFLKETPIVAKSYTKLALFTLLCCQNRHCTKQILRSSTKSSQPSLKYTE